MPEVDCGGFASSTQLVSGLCLKIQVVVYWCGKHKVFDIYSFII